MAYIPPHKRHSMDSERPTPASLIPRFNRNVQFRASSGRPVYSNYATSRWFAVGLDDGKGEASAAHLMPVSVPVESFEWRTGKKPLILVKNNLYQNKAKECPCSSIAENVLPDILSSFEMSSAEIESSDFKDVKRTVVARIGKMLFQGSPSVNLSGSKDYLRESTLSKLKRTFYTVLPDTYTANIIAEVAMKIGFDFAGVKDSYQVKLSDSTKPDSIIFCKCRVNDGKNLQLYKIELHPVRDMVVDISCIDMDLDIRLAMTHKRIITYMTEDEMQSIQNLIDSAVLDPDVKGGLRWPSTKESGNRYNVVAVWHAKATFYENASIRLRVSDSNEVVLKLKGILLRLLEQDVETNVIFDMLKDNLSFIWQHFLSCEPFLA
ncbi:hypothetical protein like AT2G38430 [Hibiscus trionum]|uniref:DUF7903 domain-containing protein n=1 Tax=Hibiscus trionum TaxID=183268 RepID=A0A9W7HKK1_HIBTR|nr:hypothetical protein like AT2G38430 [Hibiscus trionum]